MIATDYGDVDFDILVDDYGRLVGRWNATFHRDCLDCKVNL